MGPIGCPETSVSSYNYTLLNLPEKQIYFATEVWNLASLCVVTQSIKPEICYMAFTDEFEPHP
jgi:hypothetical protein